MHSKKQQLEESAAFLKNKGIQPPDFGIILGTGLGDLVQEMEVEIEIPYADIPHYPSSTMEFHQARLLYGMLSGRKVVVFEGRFHAYEGLSYFEITYPIRLMHALGVKKVIISNAAGAINLDYKKGEVMLIEDHINLQAGSPLAEKDSESLGPRFVDMSSPYSPSLCHRIKEIAKEKAISLHSGVYVAVTGPQLETKAEYRYLRLIGADAVGMSTVPEVIVANQLEMECVAFSVLTDECDPDNLKPIDIEDIMASAKKAEQSLIVLVKTLLSNQEK
jgi:purine-nucleoside phosphorylase